MNEEFIIRKLLKSKIKGVDNYKHNGSTWLIFTNEKKWVIELTSQGTLWYNYYFFKEIFDFFVGFDVVENQHYITKWVEDEIINKKPVQNGLKETSAGVLKDEITVEDTIQNGVRHTIDTSYHKMQKVEDTIQNGVKDTVYALHNKRMNVEDTIQNGVKDTFKCQVTNTAVVEDTIQNGVKNTVQFLEYPTEIIENTIQNGVKFAQPAFPISDKRVEDTIQNGVKETKHNMFEDGLAMEETIQKGVKEIRNKELSKSQVKRIVKNGIKETESIASHRTWKSDEVIQNGVKYTGDRQGNYNLVVEDTIQNGVKETICGVLQIYNPMNFQPIFTEMKRMNEVNNVLDCGIKKTEGAMLFDETKIDSVISEGVKATTTNLYLSEDDVQYEEINDVIKNGIKEVKELPDKSGELMGYGEYYARQKNRTYPHNYIVNDVIRDGIKETKPMDEWVNTERILDGVIEGGEKC